MDIKDCFICGYFDDSGNGDYIVECSKNQVGLYLKSIGEELSEDELKSKLKDRLGYKTEFTLLLV